MTHRELIWWFTVFTCNDSQRHDSVLNDLGVIISFWANIHLLEGNPASELSTVHPPTFLSNSQVAETRDLYIMTRCSCLRPNNVSCCPKGGNAREKRRFAYYNHWTTLGLFRTDFGESEPYRFASFSRLKLASETAPICLTGLYVAHVSDAVWPEKV
jgi:hypothetical protein